MLKRSQELIRHIVCKPDFPPASLVLNTHIRQRKYPNWTSYSVKYKDVSNDQFGLTHFNWCVDDHNYHILRTGSWPYIKYYCMKRAPADLEQEDHFYTLIKLCNLGIPCLMYGLATWCLITHHEVVHTDRGSVRVYFLNEETKQGGH